MYQREAKKFKFIYFLAALVWAGFIYYLSSIPDLKSSLPTLYDLIFRKIAHLSEYALLAYLIARGFNYHSQKYYIYSAALSILYAFSDEMHQLGVWGRQGSPRDILIDTIGVLIGLIIYFEQKSQRK